MLFLYSGCFSRISLISLFIASIGAVYAADGDTLWEKDCDVEQWNYAHRVVVDSKNKVIATGKSQADSSTNYYFYTIK